MTAQMALTKPLCNRPVPLQVSCPLLMQWTASIQRHCNDRLWL
jgi:hypothetical protein